MRSGLVERVHEVVQLKSEFGALVDVPIITRSIPQARPMMMQGDISTVPESVDGRSASPPLEGTVP